MAPPAPPLPDRIGRYRIVGVLGRGSMGTVYRGRDEALERDVAVKVVTVGTSDPDTLGRFRREAKAAGRLQHPNIVTVYEFGDHDGAPFLALELLEGVDLQAAIDLGVKPDPKKTLPVVLQLLAGLSHAHEHGIVHRDVKPSNVFLPKGRPAKITDFGVARLAGGATTALGRTTVGVVVGTPNYMSPEQAMGREVDGRSDLFSVGLILFELVTGERAFKADTVVSVLFKIIHDPVDMGRIPRGPKWALLRQVIERALAKSPTDRYPDARAMAAELTEALRQLGGPPDPLSTSSDGALVRRPAATMRIEERPTLVAPRTLAASATDVGQPTQVSAPMTAPVSLDAPTWAAYSPAAAVAPEAPASSPAFWLIAGAAGVFAVAAGGLFALWLLRGGSVSPSPGPTPQPSVALPTPGPTVEPRTIATATPRPTAIPTVAPASPAGTTPTPTPFPGVPSPSARPAASPEPLVSAEPRPPAGSVAARLQHANALMDGRHYKSALTEARAILAIEPSNAEARELAADAEAALVIEDALEKGRAAMRRGDRDGALAEARRGLAINPNEGRLLALFREASQ